MIAMKREVAAHSMRQVFRGAKVMYQIGDKSLYNNQVYHKV